MLKLKENGKSLQKTMSINLIKKDPEKEPAFKVGDWVFK